MLRLLLLALYLAASFAASPPARQPARQHLGAASQSGPAVVTIDGGGGLDPDGLHTTAPSTTADIGGGLDPNG